jgi:hypothetical protein
MHAGQPKTIKALAAALFSKAETTAEIARMYKGMREQSKKAWPHVTGDQRGALARYRGQGYMLINRLLRRTHENAAPNKAKARGKDDDDDGEGEDARTPLSWSEAHRWASAPEGHQEWGLPRATAKRYAVTPCMLLSMSFSSTPELIDRINKEVVHCVASLDAMFAKVCPRTTHPLVVFRGVKGEFARQLLAASSRASILVEPGFMSASLDPSVSRRFMYTEGDYAAVYDAPAEAKPKPKPQPKRRLPGKCMLVLLVPKAVPFLFLDGISGLPNDAPYELEMLMPRQIGVRVRGVSSLPDLDLSQNLRGLGAQKQGEGGRMPVVFADLVPPGASASPQTAEAVDAASLPTALKLDGNLIRQMRRLECNKTAMTHDGL